MVGHQFSLLLLATDFVGWEHGTKPSVSNNKTTIICGAPHPLGATGITYNVYPLPFRDYEGGGGGEEIKLIFALGTF